MRLVLLRLGLVAALLAPGGDFTFNSKSEALDALYGRHPTSYKLFLRIRPGKMKSEGQGAHKEHAVHGEN